MTPPRDDIPMTRPTPEIYRLLPHPTALAQSLTDQEVSSDWRDDYVDGQPFARFQRPAHGLLGSRLKDQRVEDVGGVEVELVVA